MRKTIKVEEPIYDQLDSLRIGRQTFSDVIEVLLNTRLKTLELFSVREGQIKYRERRSEQLKTLQAANR